MTAFPEPAGPASQHEILGGIFGRCVVVPVMWRDPFQDYPPLGEAMDHRFRGAREQMFHARLMDKNNSNPSTIMGEDTTIEGAIQALTVEIMHTMLRQAVVDIERMRRRAVA